MDDMDRLGIRNWRRDTRDREKWRGLINRHVTNGLVQKNIKEIIHGYKINADNRSAEEAAIACGVGPRRVTEVLMKNTNGFYACPKMSEDISTARNSGAHEITQDGVAGRDDDNHLNLCITPEE